VKRNVVPFADLGICPNYMGWLRKQLVPKRKHGNPGRTLANKVGDVRIFLKEFGTPLSWRLTTS
jgi:hypothetical protein